MDATKPMALRFGKSLRQLIDRQSGSVAGENAVWAKIRSNLAIQLGFPIQALGNCLDHQITIAQLVEMLLVIGRLDAGQFGERGQGAGIKLFQSFKRLGNVAI